MKKKGDLAWDNIGVWILMLLVMVAVLLIVFTNKEMMTDLFEKTKMFLRFGG